MNDAPYTVSGDTTSRPICGLTIRAGFLRWKDGSHWEVKLRALEYGGEMGFAGPGDLLPEPTAFEALNCLHRYIEVARTCCDSGLDSIMQDSLQVSLRNMESNARMRGTPRFTESQVKMARHIILGIASLIEHSGVEFEKFVAELQQYVRFASLNEALGLPHRS